MWSLWFSQVDTESTIMNTVYILDNNKKNNNKDRIHSSGFLIILFIIRYGTPSFRLNF